MWLIEAEVVLEKDNRPHSLSSRERGRRTCGYTITTPGVQGPLTCTPLAFGFTIRSQYLLRRPACPHRGLGRGRPGIPHPNCARHF